MGAVRGRAVEELSPGALQLLPCCITYNGPADVSSFFNPRSTGTEGDGIEVKESAFRGRRLLGSTLPLPQNYAGFVLEKQQSDVWMPKARFRDITYWNHDTVPSNADSLRRCIEWLDMSAMIHKHVSEDDVATAVKEIEGRAIEGDVVLGESK